MRRLYIVVEGQTEESFVKKVLSPYIKIKSANEGLLIQAIVVKTKREISGHSFKGGINKYASLRKDILNISDFDSLITTMIDYYGLPNDFPGKSNLPPGKIYDKINYLYDMWAKDIARENFIPYLFLHEFETLLFVNPKIAAETFLNPDAEKEMIEINQIYGNIEEINNGPTSHPSARIETIYPDYNKVQDGTIITQKIGIDVIRSKCKNFDQWVERLLETIK